MAVLDEIARVAVERVARIDAVPTILDVICRTTGMGFAAVARVTKERWIACSLLDQISFGLAPGGELQVQTTICDEVRSNGKPIIIEDVDQDPAFCSHSTPALYGFQSYISMPIVRESGDFWGTLCVIDPRPRKLKTPEVIGMVRLFAQLIGNQLDAQERLERSEATVASQTQEAELREQFIAVLGHDLRNPLTAVDAGVRQLARQATDERSKNIAGLVHGSVRRMAGLIDSIMDLARGRLGGGITLDRKPTDPEELLEQVVAEVRAGFPSRVIVTDFDLTSDIDCDPVRVSQLASNLIANAVSHGAPDEPIHVQASIQDATFKMTVSNGGEPISAAAMDHLFQPFFRANVRPSQQGLGLGLYIASIIAQAHGGSLEATSTPEQTTFTVYLPCSSLL